MKKIVTMTLCLALLTSVLVTGASAAGGFQNFQKSQTYSGVFKDVAVDSWYFKNVSSVFEYGLMRGVSGEQFAPGQNVRISEAIAMAARLHSIYFTGTGTFTEGTPWYDAYVKYAVDNGIITAGQFTDYDAYATRAQFAQIFANALPSDALAVKNNISDGSIPDVKSDASYIYTLFRAGIIVGKTENGMFYPDDNIQRSEAAAVVTRMADQTLRVSFVIAPGNTSGADNSLAALKSQVLSAKDASSAASKSYDKAKTYYLAGALGSESGNYNKAMLSALDKAAGSIKDCGKYSQDAMALCEKDASLKKVYDKLKSIVQSSSMIKDLITATAKEPNSANWKKGESYLDASNKALDEVIQMLG